MNASEAKEQAKAQGAKLPEVRDLATIVGEAGALDMSDALDLEFAGWKPEPGDKLVGHVLYTGTTDSDWGPYPIVAVLTDDGEPVLVHAFHKVLRSAVERQAPQRGDRIGVKYVGRTTKGGTTGEGYELYNVIVTKP